MYRATKRVDAAHSDSIWTLNWTASNRLISGSLDETVKTWQWKGEEGLAPEHVLDGHQLGCISVASDCTGDVLVTSSMDSNIRVFNAADGKDTNIIDAGPVETWSIAHHPSLRQVATGSQSGKVNIWNLDRGEKEKSFDTYGKFVMSVAYSPDGSRIACGGYDGSVSVFDATTGAMTEKKLEGHSMPIRSIKWAPMSGSVLYTASDDGRVNVYDTSSSESHSATLVQSLPGHLSWVLCVDASSDGNNIATGSSDKQVKLWDIRRRECVHTFDSHTDQVWAVAYSPDGAHLASAGDDAALQLYTVQ